MDIAVMGAGGVGGYFGGLLARAGHNVTFIARGPHLEAMRSNGLRVESGNDGIFTVPGNATDDPASVVARLGRAELVRREGEVTGRMKRKLLALRRLVESGTTRVVIADGRVEHPISEALAGRGTVIG